MSRTLKALLKTIGSIILGVTFVFLVNTFPIIMAILLVIALIITVFILFYNEEDQSMNKEEIEDIKDDLRTLHKILWNEHREGTYAIQKILEYTNCLEQKESILAKVTDTLKERIKELDKLKENYIKLKEYDQVDFTLCKKREVQKILNIIEGEKK